MKGWVQGSNLLIQCWLCLGREPAAYSVGWFYSQIPPNPVDKADSLVVMSCPVVHMWVCIHEQDAWRAVCEHMCSTESVLEQAIARNQSLSVTLWLSASDNGVVVRRWGPRLAQPPSFLKGWKVRELMSNVVSHPCLSLDKPPFPSLRGIPGQASMFSHCTSYLGACDGGRSVATACLLLVWQQRCFRGVGRDVNMWSSTHVCEPGGFGLPVLGCALPVTGLLVSPCAGLYACFHTRGCTLVSIHPYVPDISCNA